MTASIRTAIAIVLFLNKGCRVCTSSMLRGGNRAFAGADGPQLENTLLAQTNLPSSAIVIFLVKPKGRDERLSTEEQGSLRRAPALRLKGILRYYKTKRGGPAWHREESFTDRNISWRRTGRALQDGGWAGPAYEQGTHIIQENRSLSGPAIHSPIVQ
jgi:hypothetical protein